MFQKSVIPAATIIKGDIKEEGKVTAKWRGQLYEAAIVKLGKWQTGFCLRFSYCFISQMKSVLTSLITEKTGRKRKLVGEKKTSAKDHQ